MPLSGGFAALLRRHRLARRLTQEALAELAGISSRSIGEIERGRGRSPRPQTVERLATALELPDSDRAEFVRVGRALAWAGRADGSGAAQPPPPQCQLPADLPDFVGRDGELAALRDVLGMPADGLRLAVVSGPPGIGKTALAVRAGHRIAKAFPDGLLFVALRDDAGAPVDAGEALGHTLRALGMDGSALPAGLCARAALLRARLAGRRVLLVLDDAAGHRQVEALLPPAGAAVLVTSRLPLTGLPGAVNLDLRPLDEPAAVELLCRVAGPLRVQAQPAAAAQLVAACGGLPLAVRVAAARLAARPDWTVSELAGRLANERRRLDELSYGDLAVRPRLQSAYDGLSPLAAKAFGLLGGLGVPSLPEWPVALLLDTDPATGGAALDELLDARLVEGRGRDRSGQARYGLHGVTRLFARECHAATIDPGGWAAALARAAAGWLTRCRLHGDPCFRAEREALRALVSACAEAGLTELAHSLARCAYSVHWQRITEPALAIAGPPK